MGNLRHFPNRHIIKAYRSNDPNSDMCPGVYCLMDDQKACFTKCRHAQAQAIVEARPLREVPIEIEEIDPLAPARGVLFGLALSAFLVVSAICIGYGIADLWSLFWGAK